MLKKLVGVVLIVFFFLKIVIWLVIWLVVIILWVINIMFIFLFVKECSWFKIICRVFGCNLGVGLFVIIKEILLLIYVVNKICWSILLESWKGYKLLLFFFKLNCWNNFFWVVFEFFEIFKCIWCLIFVDGFK